MKKFYFILVISLFSYKCLASEIQFIHLKNGLVIDAKNDIYDIDLSEIKAIEINDSSIDSNLILNLTPPKKNGHFLIIENTRASKIGGEGGGG